MSASVTTRFWQGRRVLLTGHTGFKGSWAALWLCQMGAEVTGISLEPEDTNAHYNQIADKLPLSHHIVDIRDKEALGAAVRQANPEIVLHMAAQALVRRSYVHPVETFETNVMGTANLLECLTDCADLQAVLIITSDKVYKNLDDGRVFTEDDPLGGDDPYSASKAAAEIVTASFDKSFYRRADIPLATGRAGNVIGGGDFAEDRLIPDIYRAAAKAKPVTLRHPGSTRPWQHVLESVSGYLVYLEALVADTERALPRALNFGPRTAETLTVGEIADEIQQAFGINKNWDLDKADTPPEKAFLSLNTDLAQQALSWKTAWNTAQTLEKTVAWYKAMSEGQDMYLYSLSQIEEYEAANG